MFVAIPIEVRQVRAPATKPTANAILVAINVVAFTLGWATSWHLGPQQGWSTVLTYGFSHATLWHLIGNMYVLLLIGNPVNRRLGNGYYLLAYLGTLVAMGLLGRLIGVGPLMGASGAIFAVIAIFLMLMPTAMVGLRYFALFPVSLLVGIFSKPDEWLEWFYRDGNFALRAWWSLILVPVVEVWSIVWWRTSLGEWQWSHMAHLLGLICGVCIVLLLPKRITTGYCSGLV